MIGSRILNYQIVEEIGKGGMAKVYLAKHITFENRKVAIKILESIFSKNTDITSRFEREAKIMASLEHPNIVKVIDFVSVKDSLAIIMEYLNGQNLKNAIQENKLSIEQKINLFKQILSAIDYGHKHKIIHRDIKPSNIFLVDNLSTAKVLDFGIAKMLDSDNQKTVTGLTMGTPMFMSPEQVKGQKNINQRTDIYSLGVLLYYIISGTSPYNKNDSQYNILTKIVEETLPDLKIEQQYNYIIKKATAKKPDERFQNCEEFKNAFDNSNELSGFISVNPDFLEKEKEKPSQKQENTRSSQQKIYNVKYGQAKPKAEQEKKQENIHFSQRKIYNVKYGQAKPKTEQGKKKEEQKQAYKQKQSTKHVKHKTKKNKRKIWIWILLLCLIFFAYKLNKHYAFTAPKTWSKNYGGSGNDVAYSVLSDGNNIFVGGFNKSFGSSSMNWYLLNLDSKGKILWYKDIDAFNRGDAIHSIIKTNDNNYLVVGGAYKDDTYKSQNRIMKFDKNGNIIWNKFYGYYGWDEAVDVTNADNNSYILIFTDDTGDNTRCGLFKLNSKGNLIWEQCIGDYGNYSSRAILKVNDNEYVICGKVTYLDHTTKAFFIGINEQGKVIFSKIFGRSYYNTCANSMVLTRWGRIIVVGFAQKDEDSGKDIWIAKMKDNGEFVNDIDFPEYNNQEALSVAQTPDYNYVLAGYTEKSEDNTDGLLIEFDDNLNIIRKKILDNSLNDKFNSVTTTQKYIIAAGYTTTVDGKKDVWVVKQDFLNQN